MKAITLRKDGRYVTTVNLSNGTRNHIYGKTEEQVKQKLKKLTRPAPSKVNTDPKHATVAQFLNRWLDETVPLRTKPKTREDYQLLVKYHLIPHIGKIKLAELKPEHVQAMINEHSKRLAPRSVRNIRACLRCALNHAMRWEYVTRNVAMLVDIPRIKKYHVHVFTPEQAQQFLDSIVGHRLETLYNMALVLGLRLGELLALQWENVDLRNGTLHIVATLQRYNGKLHRDEPKTESSNAIVPIPPRIVAQLQKHQQTHGYVFLSTHNTPIEPRNLYQQFKRLLKKAGLPQTFRFHDLRHTCATFLLANGESLQAVKEHLRHTDITVTSNYYGHLLDKGRRQTVNRLDEFLLRKEACE